MSEIAPDRAKFDATKRVQMAASDPKASAWVSANAGSGKTHVLTQRVLRLLLDGAAPSKVLCLTFTKAAAANMSAKVFRALAAWTQLSDADLSLAIVELGAPTPDASMLDRARRLFARAVETPGGLKIQTIHAFCERVLHLFPFEANIPAGFRVIVDAEAAELKLEARALALAQLEREPEGRAALEIVRPFLNEDIFNDGFNFGLKARLDLEVALEDADRHSGYARALGRRLGLQRGQSVGSIRTEILQGLGGPMNWAATIGQLQAGSANDNKLASDLQSAESSAGEARLEFYFSVFFTDKGGRRGTEQRPIITKALAGIYPGLREALIAEQDRLVVLREALRCAEVASQSAGMLTVLSASLRAYARLKNAHGVLDFEDLIERSLALLRRSSSAWVLHKLDAGIDHILVDEAQDTSKAQWEILTLIAEEFTAGAGARQTERTFFAVGDEKQSIFSFQGAAPKMFAQMRQEFKRRVSAAAMPFTDVKLILSFRSSPFILAGVDKTFSAEAAYRGVTANAEPPPPHEARWADLPGCVEIWPPVQGQSSEASASWLLPVDLVLPTAPAVTLAERIAKTIAEWLTPGARECVHDPKTMQPRAIRAGDVMILVRTRDALFEAMIRALKQAHIPVAGADQLNLKEHIAVMDLMAAGRWALNSDDDLSLACVLKSPLIGFDDDDLLALAPLREHSLAQALEIATQTRYRQTAARLRRWRRWAEMLPPFDFYSRLLGAEGGRRAMLARLGPEAIEAINEFLALAQAHDARRPASLQIFLHELESADIVVKRDMDSHADSVRVMTVHAAKGLEAPIVFLPDNCKTPHPRHDPKFLPIDAGPSGGPPYFAFVHKKVNVEAAVLSKAREAAREASAEEYRRLLYVAMTRAAERLIIAGYCGVSGPDAGCWSQLVRVGLADAAQETPAPWNAAETIWRLGAVARFPGLAAPAAVASARPRPGWLTAAPAIERGAAPLRAAAGRAKPFAAVDRAGLEAGRLEHALLQYLPDLARERREQAAAHYLERRGGRLTAMQRAAMLRRVSRVLDRPELSLLFGPQARAEAPIAASFARAKAPPFEFSGRIDRIATSTDAVMLADFKGGGVPQGGAPDAYVRQLALYRAAIAPLFPERTVRAMIVWLHDATIEEIDSAQLDAAFDAVINNT